MMTSYIVSPTNEWESLGFNHHDNGYIYKELTSINSPFELMLIIWPPGTCSKAHDHGISHNLTWLLPIGNQPTLRTTLFKVSQDQLQTVKQSYLGKNQTTAIAGKQFHYVAPHQIHEIANESLNTAVTLHLYYPRRNRRIQ